MELNFCSKFATAALFVAPLWAADSAAAIFERAASALQSQNYSEAEAGFRAVLLAEPRNVGALGNLGVVYSRTRRYAQAIGSYQAALKVAPRDRGLLMNLGIAYVKQERYKPALPIFQALASADAANLQARELLGSCLLSLGEYEKALAVSVPLSAAEPENPAPYYMQAIALTRLHRKEEAQAAFSGLIHAATPSLASFLMGKAYYETGDFERAVNLFGQALSGDPNLEGVHRELGKTLISLRRDDEAETELRKAGADDPEAQYFLGALLSHSHPEEATLLLNRAHAMMPDFWGPLYYLGRLALEQKRSSEAVALLNRAASLKPDESAVHYQLAKAYQQQGKPAEAKASFRHVQELKGQALNKAIDILATR